MSRLFQTFTTRTTSAQLYFHLLHGWSDSSKHSRQKLLAFCMEALNSPNWKLAAAIRNGRALAARRSEKCSLKWNDISQEAVWYLMDTYKISISRTIKIFERCEYDNIAHLDWKKGYRTIFPPLLLPPPNWYCLWRQFYVIYVHMFATFYYKPLKVSKFAKDIIKIIAFCTNSIEFVLKKYNSNWII